MDKLKLVKEAFLSDFNISVVFKQICIEVQQQYNIKVGKQYHKYTQDMMHYLFYVYAKKFTSIHLKKGKKTVILMNAVTIKRVLSNIIEFKSPPKQQVKSRESSTDVFDLPPVFLGSVKVETLLYNDDYCVNVKDILNSNNETHEWWDSQEAKEEDSIKDTTIKDTTREDSLDEFTRIQNEIDNDMNEQENVKEEECIQEDEKEQEKVQEDEKEQEKVQEDEKVQELQENAQEETVQEKVKEEQVVVEKHLFNENRNPFHKKRKLKLLNL